MTLPRRAGHDRRSACPCAWRAGSPAFAGGPHRQWRHGRNRGRPGRFRAFALRHRFRRLRRARRDGRRSDPDLGAPCRRGAYGESGRRSRNGKCPVAAATARQTHLASAWAPNRPPRTRQAATAATVLSPVPPSILCFAGRCGIEGSWDEWERVGDRPPTRKTGRRIQAPHAVSAGNVRRRCHPGNAAGTLEESEGTEDRRVDDWPGAWLRYHTLDYGG